MPVVGVYDAIGGGDSDGGIDIPCSSRCEGDVVLNERRGSRNLSWRVRRMQRPSGLDILSHAIVCTKMIRDERGLDTPESKAMDFSRDATKLNITVHYKYSYLTSPPKLTPQPIYFYN